MFSPTVRTGAFSQTERRVILGLTLVAAVLTDLLFFPLTLEDAFITFRYAEHLAEGYGLGAWNKVGAPVEGYTTFLWMSLLGGASFVGLDVRTAAKVGGVAAHLLLCAVPALWAQRDNSSSPNEGLLASVFLALYLPVVWYATSGMETVLFAALTGACLLLASRARAGWYALVLVATVLLRPEGLVVVGAGLLLRAATRPHPIRAVGGPLGAVVLAALGLLAYRWFFFGEVVPNTYWAKAGGGGAQHLRLGVRYVLGWVAQQPALTFVGVIALLSLVSALRRTAPQWWPWTGLAAVGLLAFFSLYFVKVGGDNFAAFPFWRHYVHLAAPVALLAARGVTHIFPAARWLQGAALLILLALSNVGMLRAHRNQMAQDLRTAIPSFPNLTHAPPNPYFVALAALATDTTTVASAYGGEMPYLVDAVHLDVLGLNDPYLARHGTFDPNGPQDSKSDMGWVMAQRPEIVEGYLPASVVLRGDSVALAAYLTTAGRAKMVREMLTSPVFQREYCFVQNWPYDALDRALFVRQDVCDAYRGELSGVPVSETVLRYEATRRATAPR